MGAAGEAFPLRTLRNSGVLDCRFRNGYGPDLPSFRWSVLPPGRTPVEIASFIPTTVRFPDSPVRSLSLLIAKYMAIASCLLGITGFVSPSIASVRTARYCRRDDLFWNRPFLSPPCQVKKDVSDPIRRLCVRDDSPDISSI